MKRSLLSLLLAATLVASPLARPTLVQAARPLVFQAEGVGAGDCHAQTAETACLQAHCYWCKSAAVPSSCYSEDEASQLPPAVFQCDKAPSVTSWELTEVPSDAEEVATLFASWKVAHGKAYASPLEDALRRDVFAENAQLVAAHNGRRDATFTLELNQFADTTWEEFQRWYLGAPQSCSATHGAGSDATVNVEDVPEEKDWREEGMVSPVKNQGKCGSCWTFSSTGCLESHLKIKHGKLVLLSEQNLLDCAQAFDNHGCNGGLPSHAFEFVHYNGGLDTEETYPYEAKEGKCKFNTYHVGVQVDAVVNITARDESELKTAVAAAGPVSVAFQVVKDFRFYKSGVYSSTECKDGEQDVNHAVLAVGYGAEDGKKHWIIKNSWGAAWGMDGFFLMERDRNMCGVADCAAYPVVH